MMHLPKGRRTPLASAVAAAIALSSAGGARIAQAQEGDRGQQRVLEEITVTTERRENTEATTAISIEVLTDDYLATNQIKDIIDLQNAVPGLQFFQNGSYVQANIRGVGNPSRGGPSEQVGVPIFFDGATQGEEMSLASGFFDVGDVQVLRGPQATFVGQAAAGGAILINSARPNFDGLNGFGEMTVGAYGQRKLAGALNLPVSDTIAARLAYMSEERDSFYNNIGGHRSTGGESNVPGAQTDQNFRASLLWEPNANFSLWTKLERTHLEGHGIPQQPNPNSYTGFWDDDGDPNTPSVQVTTYAPHAQGPMPGTGTMIDTDGDMVPDTLYGGISGPGGVLYDPLDPFEINMPRDQFRRQTNNRLSIEPTWTTDSGLTFRLLSSWINLDRLQAETGDSAVRDSLTGFELGPDMLTYSHEFNIISPEGQRLEWLIGLYRNSRHTELSLNIPLDNPNCGWQYDSSWTPCPTGVGASNVRLYWTSTDDVTHEAYYGQLNFDLTDELELVVEGRHNSDDNIQVRKTQVALTAQLPGTVPCLGQADANVFYCTPDVGEVASTTTAPLVWKDSLPTYKVGLNWEPADGQFFYAFFARGYKSGQSGIPLAPPITEEVVDDIEIGWKGTVLDGRLYAELGVFSMDYSKMQMSGFTTTPIEAANATLNIGDSTIDGFEGSMRLLVGGFGFNMNLNYVDSKLGELTTVDTRALPFNLAPGASYPGDTSKGCVPATATAGSCFDYSPYVISLTGSQNLFSPKVSYTIGVDYAFQLTNGGTLTPSLGLNHADSTYSSILQRPGDLYYSTGERDIYNLNLTYERDDWTVQLFGTNITDEVFIEGHSNNAAAVLWGDPEVWGVRFRYDF